MQYIEHVLDYILSDQRLSTIFSNENTIFSSINRQVKKGSALTERQHLLIKSKILEKQEHLNIDNLEEILSNSSMPFRQLDRSQYVSIVQQDSVFDGKPSIKIKFPFNKKTIVAVENIATKYRSFYHHPKGTHTHYFKLHEPIVLDIVDVFSCKQFIIDPQLTDFATQIRDIKNTPESFIPGVYNYELRNFRESAINLIQNEVGEINKTSLIKLKDRSRRYGISHIECNDPGGLVGHIAFRKDQDLLIDPEKWSVDYIVEALVKLDRFPLLVLLDEGSELEQISKVYNAFSNVVPSEKQVCLFRVENTNDVYNLNNFIQDQNFNNFLDEQTDIVYISKSKLPKLLLRVDWKPMCVLALSSSRSNNIVSLYIKETCDLIMYRDREHSPFRSTNAQY